MGGQGRLLYGTGSLFRSLLPSSLTLGISFPFLGAQQGLKKRSAIFVRHFWTLRWEVSQGSGKVNRTRHLNMRRAWRPHFADREGVQVAKQTGPRAVSGTTGPKPAHDPPNRTVRRPDRPTPPTLPSPQSPVPHTPQPPRGPYFTFLPTPAAEACGGAASWAEGAGPGADCPGSLTAAWCTRARRPLTFPMSRLSPTADRKQRGRRVGACRKLLLHSRSPAETRAQAAGFRDPPRSGCAASRPEPGRLRVWPRRGGAVSWPRPVPTS